VSGQKAIEPANYGGFVLAFEPARTEKIAEILRVYGEASESFSAEDWNFERCELVLLARRHPENAIFAAVLMKRMGGSGGTRRVKMRLTEPVLLGPPVLASEADDPALLASAVSTAESLKRFDPAAWRRILELAQDS